MNKKFFAFFVLLATFLLISKVQAAGMCTGPIYTDAAASQACASLAESQGSALGYTITCTSKQVGFPFDDPNTGLRYYFDATCTVNGYDGNAAQLLAGYEGFTGTVNGHYLTWSGNNPGWDVLAANLKTYAAVEKCGGYNFAMDSSGNFYCLPTTTTTTTTNTGSNTQTTQTTTQTSQNTTSVQNAYVQSLINTVNNIIQKYRAAQQLINSADDSYSPANTTTSSSATTATTATTNTSGTFTITVNADLLNVRSAPITSAAVLSQMKSGTTFTATCYVVGETVEGSSNWWKTTSGNYVWAGGTKEQPASVGAPLCGASSSSSQTSTGGSSSTSSGTLDAWVSANGNRNGTIAAVGENISYAWSSTGATSATSNYTADAPDNCVGGIGTQGQVKPWIASSLYGNDSATVQECQAWRTYNINYITSNTSGNQLTKTMTVKTFPRCTGQIYSDSAASQTCASLAESVGKSLGLSISCSSKQVSTGFDPNTGLNYYYDATCTVNGQDGNAAQLLAGYEGFTGTVNGHYLTWSGNINGWNNLAAVSGSTSSQTTTTSASDARVQQIITQANTIMYSSLTSDEKNALNAYLIANGSALINQHFQYFAPGSVFAWALGMGTDTTLNAAAKSLGFTTLNPVSGVFVVTPGYTIQ